MTPDSRQRGTPYPPPSCGGWGRPMARPRQSAAPVLSLRPRPPPGPRRCGAPCWPPPPHSDSQSPASGNSTSGCMYFYIRCSSPPVNMFPAEARGQRTEVNVFPTDNNNDVHTPMQSIFSKSQSSSKSQGSHHSNSHTLPKMSPSVSDVHSPMQSSFFSPKTSSNSGFNNGGGANSKTSPLHINTDRDIDRHG